MPSMGVTVAPAASMMRSKAITLTTTKWRPPLYTDYKPRFPQPM